MYFYREYMKTAKWWQILLAKLLGPKTVCYEGTGTRVVTYTWQNIVYVTEITT